MDKFVWSFCRSFDFVLIQKLIRKRKVRINGKRIVKPNVLVYEGDEVTMHFSVSEQDSKSGKIKITTNSMLEDDWVFYEDDKVLVINKPSGYSMHSGPNNLNDAVYNYLLKKGEMIQDQSFKVHHLHRLDKDTKGLCVYAKTREAFQYLDKQFKNREVTKRYTAIVKKPETNFVKKIPLEIKKNYFINDGWVELTDDTTQRSMSMIIENCEELNIEKGEFLMYTIKSVTGRKHQIRILLSYLGQPIEGDSLFNTESKARNLMLFSKEIKFIKKDKAPLNVYSFLLNEDDIKNYAISNL